MKCFFASTYLLFAYALVFSNAATVYSFHSKQQLVSTSGCDCVWGCSGLLVSATGRLDSGDLVCGFGHDKAERNRQGVVFASGAVELEIWETMFRLRLKPGYL